MESCCCVDDVDVIIGLLYLLFEVVIIGWLNCFMSIKCKLLYGNIIFKLLSIGVMFFVMGVLCFFGVSKIGFIEFDRSVLFWLFIII